MQLKKIPMQLSLLLWKNFMLQFRRPIGSICELATPILGVLFIVILRLSLKDQSTSGHCFSTFDAIPLQANLNSPSNETFAQLKLRSSCKYTYYYTPDDNVTKTIIAKIKSALDLPKLSDQNYQVNFVGVSTEKDLENKSRVYFDNLNSAAQNSATFCNSLYYQAR